MTEQLYTRQQIRERTGIPEDTLNYFVREGLLQASEGGGGKGQHRKFAAIEVTIAAVLFQLKANAGANIGVLREVVQSFRDSFAAVGAMPAAATAMLEALTDILNGEPGEASPVPEEAAKYIREQGVWAVRSDLFNYLTLTNWSPSRATNADFLYRDADGKWVFETSLGHAPEGTYTFVAINMNDLLCSVWDDKD